MQKKIIFASIYLIEDWILKKKTEMLNLFWFLFLVKPTKSYYDLKKGQSPVKIMRSSGISKYRLDPIISEGFDKRISIFCKTRLLANSLIIELAYANNRIFCLNQFYATIYTMKKMDQITSILSNLKKYFFAYFQTDSYLE